MHNLVAELNRLTALWEETIAPALGMIQAQAEARIGVLRAEAARVESFATPTTGVRSEGLRVSASLRDVARLLQQTLLCPKGEASAHGRVGTAAAGHRMPMAGSPGRGMRPAMIRSSQARASTPVTLNLPKFCTSLMPTPPRTAAQSPSGKPPPRNLLAIRAAVGLRRFWSPSAQMLR